MKDIFKFILISPLIYFLTLFQSGFLAHFRLFGVFPNLILILVVVVNLWEEPKNRFGVFVAFFGGLLVDVFSSRPIGFNVLIFLAAVLFIKVILKNYVRIPFGKKT